MGAKADSKASALARIVNAGGLMSACPVSQFRTRRRQGYVIKKVVDARRRGNKPSGEPLSACKANNFHLCNQKNKENTIRFLEDN